MAKSEYDAKGAAAGGRDGRKAGAGDEESLKSDCAVYMLSLSVTTDAGCRLGTAAGKPCPLLAKTLDRLDGLC